MPSSLESSSPKRTTHAVCSRSSPPSRSDQNGDFGNGLLKRHPQTRDLVPQKKELTEVDKTLQELDGLPKEDESFLKRLGELKRAVERHLREEERKIVPALKRALNDDEIEAIARRLAAEKHDERQGADGPEAAAEHVIK